MVHEYRPRLIEYNCDGGELLLEAYLHFVDSFSTHQMTVRSNFAVKLIFLQFESLKR